jgi:hypothetical protein
MDSGFIRSEHTRLSSINEVDDDDDGIEPFLRHVRTISMFGKLVSVYGPNVPANRQSVPLYTVLFYRNSKKWAIGFDLLQSELQRSADFLSCRIVCIRHRRIRTTMSYDENRIAGKICLLLKKVRHSQYHSVEYNKFIARIQKWNKFLLIIYRFRTTPMIMNRLIAFSD